MRSVCVLALGLCLAGRALALPPEAADGRVRDRERTRRYISAHAYYHAMRAELARANGELELARQSLRLALVYDPASPELHLALAEVQLTLGEGEPDRLIQRAIQLDPNRAGGWTAKGDLLARRGKRRAAERAYQRALRIEPDSPAGLRAARELAVSYQRSGRPELARRTLERAAAVQGPEAILLLATLDLEEGRLEEAQRGLLQLAGRGGPELGRRVAERLGWLLRFDLAHELHQGSLRAEDERLRITDRDLRTALNLALLAGDRDEALRLFERSSARASVEERRRATAAFLRAGRAEWLREELARRGGDGSPEPDIFVLALETAAGGSPAALAARAADPRTPVGRVLLAEALLRRGDANEARRSLEPMSTAEPAPLLSALGLEDYERLLAVILRLEPARAPRFLAAHPSALRAAALEARGALLRGETTAARALLEDERVESDPDTLVLLSELELAPERRRRVEERVRWELERDPERPELWRALARLCLQRGDEARARVALGRALVLDPSRGDDEALWRALVVRPELPPASRGPRRGVRP